MNCKRERYRALRDVLAERRVLLAPGLRREQVPELLQRAQRHGREEVGPAAVDKSTRTRGPRGGKTRGLEETQAQESAPEVLLLREWTTRIERQLQRAHSSRHKWDTAQQP